MSSLRRVISGGQTGADRAGLEAAKAVGIPTGGTVPRYYKTENGTDLSLMQFNLEVSASPNYPARTQTNIINSDGTLIIARYPIDGGSLMTASMCIKYKKPQLHIFQLDQIELGIARTWLLEHQIAVLNIAGNRESKQPGLQIAAQAWLEKLFKAAKEQADVKV